jgi:hypothetical protein
MTQTLYLAASLRNSAARRARWTPPSRGPRTPEPPDPGAPYIAAVVNVLAVAPSVMTPPLELSGAEVLRGSMCSHRAPMTSTWVAFMTVASFCRARPTDHPAIVPASHAHERTRWRGESTGNPLAICTELLSVA